jgi:hypothetical protein
MSTPIFNFFEKDFSVAAILYNRNSKRTGRPGQDGKTEVITICHSPFSCLDREHRPQPERIGGAGSAAVVGVLALIQSYC